MSREPKYKKTVNPPPDFSAMPEFASAIRGLAKVPKKEVDDAIAKEKSSKKPKSK